MEQDPRNLLDDLEFIVLNDLMDDLADSKSQPSQSHEKWPAPNPKQEFWIGMFVCALFAAWVILTLTS